MRTKQALGATLAFLGLAAVLVVRFLGYPPTLWKYRTVGTVSFRTHNLLGRTEMKTEAGWRMPFARPAGASATPTPGEITVTLKDLAWSQDKWLAGRAVNTGDKPVKGRLAFNIVIRDTDTGRVVKDRSLRKEVDWPARSANSFAFYTDQAPPGPRQSATVVLQSIF